MFLKSLKIENSHGLVREISFHAGMNLIVDETPNGAVKATGNNVGKTTVLMLVDFCLGSSGKGIYTDPENRKTEHALVKSFLIETKVLITLRMCESFEAESEKDLIVERNFLPRKAQVRRINGKQLTEPAFEEALTNSLFPGHYGKKPTFPQLISHNIRYKDLSVMNTLRTLDRFTRDDEYEALHLFLLGCSFDQGEEKQRLTSMLRQEAAFKARLESKQTRSAYEALLALELDGIAALERQKSELNISATLEADLEELSELKYKISRRSSEASRTKLRLNLINEAMGDLSSKRSDVDVTQLRTLYGEASERLGVLSQTFEDLVAFHNGMLEEKIRYISKDVPELKNLVESAEQDVERLLKEESLLSKKISSSGTLAQLEDLINALNDRHRKRGEYETIVKQIKESDAKIEDIKKKLSQIDKKLFSGAFEEKVTDQVKKFNRYFAAISQELYGEAYALKYDREANKSGQQVYKFSSFNTNFSSGKKQGEITCFDIAYNLFADDESIPCYHFLLNDKKELMHDNQLEKIANLVERKKGHVQFVASILRDKLPEALNKDEFIVLKLSQKDKLFRIENPKAKNA